MSLFRFFKARGAAPVARERLQILLAHERVALGPRDLVAILRDELLATIARHVEIDPEKVKVTMDRAGAYSTLEIDVEIPCDKIAASPPKRVSAIRSRPTGWGLLPRQLRRRVLQPRIPARRELEEGLRREHLQLKDRSKKSLSISGQVGSLRASE